MTIEELIKKIEQDSGDSQEYGVPYELRCVAGFLHSAEIHQSLDACYALHQALAPDFLVYEFDQYSRSLGWSMVLANERGRFVTSHAGGLNNQVGFIKHPSKAYLLAILRTQVDEDI